MHSPKFPPGTRYTPVPDPVFGPILQGVADLAELKCTLRAIWLLHHKKGYPRYLTFGELMEDRVLLSESLDQGHQRADIVRTAMTQAVHRGTFLTCHTKNNGNGDPVYLLNTEASAKAMERMSHRIIEESNSQPDRFPDQNATLARPNIFSLYEENIGMLTPLIADELKDAELNYPTTWLKEAIKLSVERNRRNWRYIRGILERWTAEGRGDGEPSGYSKKSDRRRYLEEYLRRRGTLPDS